MYFDIHSRGPSHHIFSLFERCPELLRWPIGRKFPTAKIMRLDHQKRKTCTVQCSNFFFHKCHFENAYVYRVYCVIKSFPIALS